MNRPVLSAIVAGSAVLCLAQFVLVFTLDHIDPMATPWILKVQNCVLNIVIALSSVLPGLSAGWIAQRRGAIAGLLVGVVGGLIYSVLFMALGLIHHHALGRLRLSNALMWFWDQLPSLLILGAVAGAAGELLRSNQRLERP